MATEKDKMIDELIQITKTKKLEIEGAEKPTWHTNSLFAYDTSSSKINIRTVSSTTELVRILAFVLGKENEFNLANQILGTKEKFDFNGFTKSEWISDIKTRINQITITAKKKELEDIEKQLDGLISKERREELQLQSILAKLKGE